jgi:sporulation integral membrane protein YtvI
MSLRMLLILAVGLIVLYGLFTVGSPFLLAIIFAIFLEPLNRILIEKLKWSRLWTVTTVCTVFTLAFLGIFYLIGINIYSQLLAFGKNAPTYFAQLETYLADPNWRAHFLYNTFSADVADQMNAAIESALSNLTAAINSLISGLSGLLLGLAKAIPNVFIFFLVFFIALYLVSFQLPLMKRAFIRQFAEVSQSKVEHVLHSLREAIFGFLRAQFILSALTYIVVLIGLLIIGIDYPFAIALLIIIVDILPVLGTGSVLVPWATYLFLNGNMKTAIGLLILFLVITTFRRVVEPKVLSDAIGINTLAALAALYVGFKLFGPIGLLFGPAVVIIFTAMRKAGLLDFKIKLE